MADRRSRGRRQGGSGRGRGLRGDAVRRDRRRGGGRERNQSLTDAVRARVEAARQLVRVEADDAYVGRMRVSGSDQGEIVDRRTTEYVAGVTRWKRWLDHLLAGVYRGDLATIEPALLQVLRIGAYDLVIRGMAPHAALNEAVNAARQAVRPDAAGVTNGVLRALSRLDVDAVPIDARDEAERLAVRWSHPTWLVRRWLDRFGPRDTETLLRRNNQAPVHGLRIVGPAAARTSFQDMLREADILWEPSEYLDDFVRVIRLQPIIRARWIERGYCTVQDESTGLVVRALDPQPGDTVVDACAAPGGKSLYAATRMAGSGQITAVDVSAARLGLLERAAGRVETPIATVAADFAEWAARGDGAEVDRVLLDAPCSGTGVLARRADLRWRRTEESIAELTGLQDRLLDAAAEIVRPGGLLVYATCTMESEENEDRVRAFLERHASFALDTVAGLVPETVQDADGFLRTLPFRHDVDGAFAARLRKADA